MRRAAKVFLLYKQQGIVGHCSPFKIQINVLRTYCQKKIVSWSYLLFSNSFDSLENILNSLQLLFNVFESFFESFLNIGTTFTTLNSSGNQELTMHLLICSLKILAKTLANIVFINKYCLFLMSLVDKF